MCFLISGVLQLFIAVSMIVLVLEEAKRDMREAQQGLAHQRGQADFFRATAESTERRFQQIFENASDAIFIVGATDLAILQSNQAANRLLKIVPGVALRPFNYYFSESTVSNAAAAGTWLEQISQSIECDLSRCDGTSVRVEVRGSPVPYGSARAFQFIVIELTEKARLQRQLRQAEKLSALGNIISGVAHELNNPLAAIKGYSEVLLLEKMSMHASTLRWKKLARPPATRRDWSSLS